MPDSVSRLWLQVIGRRHVAPEVLSDELPEAQDHQIPNDRDPFVITSVWRTTVDISRTGREQRFGLTGRPARRFQFLLSGLTEDTARRVRTTIARHQTARLWVPVRPDCMVVTATMSAGAVRVPVGPGVTLRRFFPGGRVGVFKVGFRHLAIESWEATIASVDVAAGEIVLAASPFTADVEAPAIVMPLARCEISSGAQYRHETSRITEGSVTFTEAVGPSALPPVIAPGNWPQNHPTFDQALVFDALWRFGASGAPLEVELTRGGSNLDVGRGTVETVLWKRSRETFDLPLTAFGREECYALLEALDHVRGRAGSFWLPNPQRTVRIASVDPTGRAVELDLGGVSFDDFQRTFPGHLAIKYRADGAIYVFEAGTWTQSKANPQRVTMHLSEAVTDGYLGTTTVAPQQALALISQPTDDPTVQYDRRAVDGMAHVAWAHRCRLDSDEVVESWQTPRILLSLIRARELIHDQEIVTAKSADPVDQNETLHPRLLNLTYPLDDPECLLYVRGGFTGYMERPSGAGAALSEGHLVARWLDVRDPLRTPLLSWSGPLYHELRIATQDRGIRAVPTSPGGAATRFALDPAERPWSASLGMTVVMVVKRRAGPDPSPGGEMTLFRTASGSIVWTPSYVAVEEDAGASFADGSFATVDVTVTRGRWHVVALTWLPGRFLRVYRDGRLAGQAPRAPLDIPYADGEAVHVFGAKNPDSDGATDDDSAIHDVVIYRRALEPWELDAISTELIAPVVSDQAVAPVTPSLPPYRRVRA